MKKLVLVSSGAMLLMVGTAVAADLPLLPPPPPPFWTGPFLGASLGFGFGSSGNQVSGKDLNCVGAFCPIVESEQQVTFEPGSQSNGTSVAGGAQLGYNFQFDPHFVLGNVVDFTVLNNSGNSTFTTSPVFLPPPNQQWSESATLADSFKNDWLVTARLKAGPTFDNLWIYGTGGLAIGDLKSSSSSVTTWNNPNQVPQSQVAASGHGSTSGIALGYVVGAGAEYKLTPNWSVFGEYLYYSLSDSYTVVVATNPNCCGGGTQSSTFGVRARVDGNLVKLGLNYAFWVY